jgi:membrane-associated phospholipid phosphatase
MRTKVMTPFERLFSVLNKPWMIASYVVLALLMYRFADKPIAIYFYQLDLRHHDHILHAITLLGKSSIYILLFALSGLFFRYVKKNELIEQRSWFLLACVVLMYMVGFVLKITFSRARPELFFMEHYFGFYWFKLNDLFWSFPSGHSMTIGSVAAGLGVLFPRYFYAFFVVALMVLYTRVGLYYHYLSDVITGLYLSVLVVGFFSEYLKKKQYLAKIV